MLTILAPEKGSASLCGRLKVISSGKTCTFTNINELYGLINSEMSGEPNMSRPPSEEQAEQQEVSAEKDFSLKEESAAYDPLDPNTDPYNSLRHLP